MNIGLLIDEHELRKDRGAGIGLIESILSAGEVVEKSRMEANEIMKSLSNQVGP